MYNVLLVPWVLRHVKKLILVVNRSDIKRKLSEIYLLDYQVFALKNKIDKAIKMATENILIGYT